MGRERWGGGNRKGETVKGQMGGGEEGARGEEETGMGRRLGWDKGEGEMERGNLKVEMERRATGRGRREGGKGEGEKKGQEEGAFYGWM